MNLISLAYILFALIISFFPTTKQVTPVTMNWSVLVWGVIVGAATITYIFHGRHKYKGPVVYVNKELEVPS